VTSLKNIRKESYHIIISILKFKESNQILIEKLFKSDLSNIKYNALCLPTPLEYFEKETKQDDSNTSFEKFYTKKSADYLPELILTCTDGELSLYGFPFTLLENAEIIKAGKLQKMNVIRYIDFIEKFNKISKRFGK